MFGLKREIVTKYTEDNSIQNSDTTPPLCYDRHHGWE